MVVSLVAKNYFVGYLTQNNPNLFRKKSGGLAERWILQRCLVYTGRVSYIRGSPIYFVQMLYFTLMWSLL